MNFSLLEFRGKVRAAKDDGKKFQSKVAASFRVIVNLNKKSFFLLQVSFIVIHNKSKE